MVKIVLSTGVLDVSENLALPITFSIGDIRDLSSRKGTFSKTVTLAGTKNNNDLLGHYYDVNIEAGTFNLNTLTKCQVIQNGVPILDEALLQLVSVSKVQTNNRFEDEVSYEVLIKDTRAEFFTAITNANLTDLDFSDLDHVFSSTNIVASFSHTVADGYKYVMPYINGNDFNANDFKPAIYAKTYFDRIFAVAGFTYTWDEIASARFDKLLIPYNGDKNNQDYEDYRVDANNTWTTSYVQPTGFNFPFQEAINSGWTEVVDAQNIYDPITGEYTTPFSTNPNASEHYLYNLTIGGSIILDNTSGADARLGQNGIFLNISNKKYRVFARINVNGFDNGKVYGPEVIVEYTTTSPLPNGTTTILTFNQTLTVPALVNDLGIPLNILSGDIQVLEVGVEMYTVAPETGSSTPYGDPIPYTSQWLSINPTPPFTGTLVPVNVVLDLTFINVSILPSSDVQVTGSTLNINQYVPKEIKQSDFVKSILQMYNLYVEQDVNNPNNLILRHRDEYYDSGAEKDWSKKLAKDKDQQLIFLPDLTNKKLKLTYAPDTDEFNTMYTQATSEIYGQIEYTFDNEYVKDVSTQELIFSPTPVFLTSFGAYVPAIIGASPNTNIRILYDGGLQSCQPFDILDFGTTGEFGLTSYPMLGHFDNALTPSFDINFGTNDFYFYEPISLTSNNLYNLYWRRTVNQINVGKMLIAMFDLTELDIQSLKLNDKIYIDNSWWNINKIQDYNGNQRQLTKVELISIDTEIDLARFKTGLGRPFGDVMIGVGVDALVGRNTFNNNVILPGANAQVFGKGNVVTAGTKGIIVGDGQTLSDDGMVINNLTVTGTINGAVVAPYKKYVALLNQSGTADPTVIILENTFSEIPTFSRISTGVYKLELIDSFTLDKTFIVTGSADVSAGTGDFATVIARRFDEDTITLYTYDNFTSSDNMLVNTSIEIRVYE
jgi:hypothetical protein